MKLINGDPVLEGDFRDTHFLLALDPPAPGYSIHQPLSKSLTPTRPHVPSAEHPGLSSPPTLPLGQRNSIALFLLAVPCRMVWRDDERPGPDGSQPSDHRC